MRSYSQAETCMLLLFAQLGEEKPLGSRTYQALKKALMALGPEASDPGAELTDRELLRLGASPEDTKAVLARLEREDALKQHLTLLRRQGITVLTRISPEYPQRLRQVLGERAPMLLYCAGDMALFGTECVSLVGSRQLRQPGRTFAEALGRAAAAEGLTYVSGGAAGADTAGYDSALASGGQAIVFVADSLLQRVHGMQKALAEGRVLLVSEYGYDQGFSAARAYSRNRLIHAMGQRVFVAQSDYGSGGTWNGVMENLTNGWSPVFMCRAEPEDPGTRGLIERGCTPISAGDLHELRAVTDSQTRLF